MHQNKDTEALDILDKIIAENKGQSMEDDALFSKSKILLEQNDFEAAIESLNHILMITPPHIYAAKTLVG